MFIYDNIKFHSQLAQRINNYNYVMDHKEYEPRPGAERTVDLLKTINNDAVSSIIRRANRDIQYPLVTTSELELLTERYQQEIIDVIDKDYSDENATVTGVAYTIDQTGNPSGQITCFYRKRMIYDGPTVQAIAGVPEIVFELYEYRVGDSGNITEDIYYMLPEDIRELEVNLSDKLFDSIAQHVDQSRQLLTSSDFLDRSTPDQHAILASILYVFHEDIRSRADKFLGVETERFMSAYDDIPVGLTDSVTDQSKMKVSKRFVPLGKYIDSVFPETINRPYVHFDSLHDFPISKGTPCMRVRDDNQGVTYVVPTGAITRLVVIDNLE